MNKKRSETNAEDKWDLLLIYKNEHAFNKDLEEVNKEIDILKDLLPTFLDTSKDFKKYYLQKEKTERLIEKLFVYSKSKKDEDIANNVSQELYGKVLNLDTKYEEQIAEEVSKILKTDKKIIDSFLNSEDMDSYNHYFDKIFDKKDHIVDENTEKALAKYEKVLKGSQTTYSYLVNSDIKFPSIKYKEKTIEVTESIYPVLIKSDDINIRKEAFKKLYEAYKSFENVITSTYSQNILYNVTTAKLRNYNSVLEMNLKKDKLPLDIYYNLIKTVRKNLSSLHKYYQLKKKMLQIDKMHLYDTYINVIGKNDKTYTFAEAQKIVLNVLDILGKDYVSVINKAFKEKWIDKYPNDGKVEGAYSIVTRTTCPYILLNYVNTYFDLRSLIHELGHSVHTFYANKENEFHNAIYPIFLGEIASTTNELLLSNYMYENASSKEEKLIILNEKLDLFKSTIFRQTMFSEFEEKAYKYVEEDNTLTSKYLYDTYYNLNKDYFGPNIEIDEEIGYEWMRIPHFYTPFYVYQYATSLSIACYIVENITNKTPGFKEKYLNFLKSGGKDYPLEILKIIDIDLTDTKIYESAINSFKDTLEKFENLYYK